ncbi:MAG: hypothetical protein LC624_01570 [Halobacteriales archaeon]|nr:hypothetical protein [Halobacteriales archaeon]
MRLRESTWLAVSGGLIAGMLHLALVAQRGGLRDAHGIVFLALGLAQLGWAGLWLVERSRAGWLLGLALAGGSIALWLVTRVARAPFGDGAEAIDAAGLVSKLAEAMIIAGLLLHEHEERRGVRRALPWVAGALALGMVTYAGGIAAESMFPNLLPAFRTRPLPASRSPRSASTRRSPSAWTPRRAPGSRARSSPTSPSTARTTSRSRG